MKLTDTPIPSVCLVRNSISLTRGTFKEQKEIKKYCTNKKMKPILVSAADCRCNRKMNKSIAVSLKQSRIRFMGTDGLRGRTTLTAGKGSLLDALQAYRRDRLISPALIYLCGHGFAAAIKSTGTFKQAVVCEDGRDQYQDALFYPALINGLNNGGLITTSMGLAPTPALAAAMHAWSIRAGLVLTASHNPANQNGIKFFLDGIKLLPEGRIGDYTLSAWMYHLARTTSGPWHPAVPEYIDRSSEGRTMFTDFICRNIPSQIKIPLIIDAANGAASLICRSVMKKLNPIQGYTILNSRPNGTNINHECGAGALEGIEEFSGAVSRNNFRLYPETIKKLFRAGRKKGDTLCIALDGDADRGYLLLYRHKNDLIEVIDGDRGGFALARYAAGRFGTRDLFAGTVESDVLLFRSVASRFGLPVEINCVGDKWLVAGNRKKRLLIGQEVSGHVMLPALIKDIHDIEQTVLCGNGLLTMLIAAAVFGTRIPRYPRGYVHTLYTYNINKQLFIRGCPIWQSDIKILKHAFNTAIAQKVFSATSSFKIVQQPNEPDLLYAGIFDNNGLPEAIIFIRCSGTEDKIGTYLRGQKKYRSLLNSIGQSINHNHVPLKDIHSPLYQAEKMVLKAITAGNTPDATDVCRICTISPADFNALMTGMRKEELL